MKKFNNKRFLTLGYIALIPVLLATMVNMIIAVSYWAGIVDNSMAFYFGKMNNGFVAFIDTIGMFGMAFFVTAMNIANRHSDKMDDLDGAIDEYNKATKEMETARDKYTDLVSKSK